jgi:hypothetical protein
MKPFNTLSQTELATLTEEQVETYIDYACAEQGVPIVFNKVEEPESLKSSSDITLVCFDSVTVDEATGKQIMQILADNNQYKKEYRSEVYQIVTSEYELSKPKLVRTKSPQLAALEAVEHAKLTREWKAYNEAQEVQKQAMEDRQKLINELYDVIYNARSFVNNKTSLIAAFDKYMAMANNDREIAKRFFANAYSNAQYELIREYILGNESAVVV